MLGQPVIQVGAEQGVLGKSGLRFQENADSLGVFFLAEGLDGLAVMLFVRGRVRLGRLRSLSR